MNIFKKRVYVTIPTPAQTEPPEEGFLPSLPDGLWVKCPSCLKTIYAKEISELKICPKCKGYFRLTAMDRISLVCDEGSFKELYANMQPKNPIGYPGYEKKVSDTQAATALKEAVVCGEGTINGYSAMICVMDPAFFMGSLGSVVGEKLTRTFEAAADKGLGVILFTASGGARMQEGIISLMQMAKVSAAVARHSKKGLLFVVVLTDPTMGGVTASYGSLGDIILAEPRAQIGFAGRRVIEQTIKQKLPEDFQSAEFLMSNGFIDRIVERKDMKKELSVILKLHK